MKCPACRINLKHCGLWSHLRKKNSHCRQYLKENGQQLGRTQVNYHNRQHKTSERGRDHYKAVFDPAGDLFGDYLEYLRDDGNNNMEIDAGPGEANHDEGSSDSDEDNDGDVADEMNMVDLEPPRPQTGSSNSGQDDQNDSDTSTKAPNRVYNASCRLHDPLIIVWFPGAAGKEYGVEELTEDQAYQRAIGAPGGIYTPFSSRMEWEIAKWAKEHSPSSTAFTDLMSIEGVSESLGLSFKSSAELNKIIDKQLPCSQPSFDHRQVLVGSEMCDVYFRDIIQFIQALLNDTNLSPQMVFAPEKHYTDDSWSIHMYHDMHTGKWWWATQKTIEKGLPGATIIPIIMSTDKTQLTLFRNKSAYPVYLMIGNIPKEICRKPSAHAYVLLGYLPTTRLEGVHNKTSRWHMATNLYHSCMGEILKPLEGPGEHGIMMATANGCIRRMHPILAAFIGDYPEQVLTACIYTGDCPSCDAPRNDLGDGNPDSGNLCDLGHALDILSSFDENPSDFIKKCKESQIKPVFSPFWHRLPYLDIYNSITPDILHQLYQGVIKHLVNWLIKALGLLEIDAYCCQLPLNHNVCSFLKGITSLSHVSGKEHDQISRILIGLIVWLDLGNGHSPAPLIRSVHALLDFLFLTQYPVHTDKTLKLLQHTLNCFHENKDIFIHLRIRTNFNLPKLHFAKHYILKIKHFGMTDNFNTEYTECLHIDLAKDAYHATNQKDEYVQMMVWLERKEKITRHEHFIQWCLNHTTSCSPSPQREWITPGLSIDRKIHVSQRPSTRCIKLDDFITKHSATYFHEALACFVTLAHYPNLSATQLKRAIWGVKMPTQNFWVWHRVKFLSTDPFTDATRTTDMIHTNPGTQHFDCALIRTNSRPNGIHNFRVGRIRVVFSMPLKIHQRVFPKGTMPEHLAYVKWYTSFPQRPEPNHLMYKISVERDQSNASDRGIGSIIPLSDIVRSVHLFPVFGPYAPIDWTSGNVLNHTNTFYVNPFTDRQLYRLIG